MKRRRRFSVIAGLVLLAACQREPAVQPGHVDGPRLAAIASEPDQWLTNGRDGDGTYFSPLTDINDRNVARLGFAWDFQLGTDRGLEATPLVIDGRMYFSGNWGRVYALDAATGKSLWRFAPPLDPAVARDACCDVVNRGIAVWHGRIYVGALDGRLFALDAKDGRVVWSADTIERDHAEYRYSVTGAPQIAGGVVVIGNGGADFGARGYVSAYDLVTGKLRWRFHTVPADPRTGPQANPALARALPTWDANTDWSKGGGGTVWDGMAYDPTLDLLYIGTGNAAPYDPRRRSPAGGDNLYLASILALRPATGELVWHYQTVPGEAWDYTATQKFILADLDIGGRKRSVLMQAPKNGFFYILDRATGALLSARPQSYVNWAKGIDRATGRPIPDPARADYSAGPRLIYPGQAGAHNWQPMAFNPRTGLVYIPAIDAGMVYIDTAKRPVAAIDGMFETAGIPTEDYDPGAMAATMGNLPDLTSLVRTAGGPAAPRARNVLRAWDPVRERVAWEQSVDGLWQAGGVMTTAGNLVFRGTAAGRLEAFAADSGRPLLSLDLGTSVIAAPMTYRIQGVQYVAVLAGYGGGGGFAYAPNTAAWRRGNAGRVIVLRLDGGAVPKPPLRPADPPIALPRDQGDPARTGEGALLFTRHCSRCHVFGRGIAPDLRRSAAVGNPVALRAIVLEGALSGGGMADFGDILDARDLEAIRAYLARQAVEAGGQSNRRN